MRRRDFLLSGAVALAGACTVGRPRAKRVLILGGTNFVGPHLVRAARDAGYEVTIFNRGITAPQPPDGVELLVGDRTAEGGLAALRGTRRWDAVIDTWAEHPRAVDEAAALLADRTDAWVYISSIAIYRQFRDHGIAEAAAPPAPALDSLPDAPSYPTAKRAAELAVERRLGSRSILLRCTSIVGSDPRMHARGEGSYWPVRMRRGGAILAPDDDGAVIQLIDVKDVAAFAVHAIDTHAAGAFNLVGPARPLPFQEYLRVLREAWLARPAAATGEEPRLVWVSPDWLIAHGATPWDVVPGWIPADDHEPGFYTISNARAVAAGLTFRPLRSTLDDVYDSLAGRTFTEEMVGGLPAARERELLAAWGAA